MIFICHPSLIEGDWPTASKTLDRAFEHSEDQQAADHLPYLLSEQEQLWCIHGIGWAITRICEGSRSRFLQTIALAGSEMDTWLDDFVRVAEAWAKENGCVKSVVSGRVGWLRKLRSYRQTHVTLVKEL